MRMCETRVSARTCARGSLRKCGSDASRSSGRVHSTRGLDSCGELARESRHKGGMPRRGRRVLRFALVGVLSSHFGLIDAFVGHQPKSEPPAAPELFVTTINGDGGPPIGLTPVGAPGTTTFTQVMLTDPLAVCNDGTQCTALKSSRHSRGTFRAFCQRVTHVHRIPAAAYYWAPGSGSSADIWVVYLEGEQETRGHAERDSLCVDPRDPPTHRVSFHRSSNPPYRIPQVLCSAGRKRGADFASPPLTFAGVDAPVPTPLPVRLTH